MLSFVPGGKTSTGIGTGVIMPNITGTAHKFPNFYITDPGQGLPLPTTGYTDRSPSGLTLNSVIHPSITNAAKYPISGDHYQRHLLGDRLSLERAELFRGETDSQMKSENLLDHIDDDDFGLSIDQDGDGGSYQQDGMNGKLTSKVCRVCGDRALGYNFNVVSCESCKAFFRRNALKKKEFRCPFNDNCDVTTLSRRFCQKCRLKKCFEVGMKKEWIMSEEQRLQKRKRIEENRKKKRALTEAQAPPQSSDTDKSSSLEPGNLESIGPNIKIARSEQQQQHDGFTNAGFSPGRSSPSGTSFNNDFSPPNSNGPAPTEHKQLESQTSIEQPTIVNVSRSFSPVTPLHSHGDIPSNNATHVRRPMKTEHFWPSSSSCGSSDTQQMVDTVPNVMDFQNELFRVFSQDILHHPYSATSSVSPHGLVVDDSSITIPKSVLINLINQCHSTRRDYLDIASKELLPPVVARAHRLYAADGCNSQEELLKCICRCTCGARAVGSAIGPKLVERGVGPDDDSCNQKASPDCEHDAALCNAQDKAVDVIVEPLLSSSLTGASSVELTALDELKLNELFYANQVIDYPDYSDENTASNEERIQQESGTPSVASSSTSSSEELALNSSASSTPDVIRMTDVCVRRIIKMCKRLSAFKALCQEDQMALLKGGCTELMLLRGVMTFIPSKECWRPVGWKNHLLSLEVLKYVKGNVYEEHRRYLHSFREEWRTCDAIMLCLAAITLFNPQRRNVIHEEAIRAERDSYIDLLKRYLGLQYGVGTFAAEEAFRELLLRVEAVERLNDYAAKIFVDVNPRDVEPLLIEIFDLK